MITRNLKFAGALLLGLLMLTSLQAQPRQGGRGLGPCGAGDGYAYRSGGLDLTEDQREVLSTMRTKHLKEITPLRNKMAELRARERTLLSEENVNVKALEKTIDEQTDLLNRMRKLQTSHQLNVKNILTDEQAMKLQQGRPFAHRDGFYGKGYRRGDRGMRMEPGSKMNRNRSNRAYPGHRGYRMNLDQETQSDRDHRMHTEI